jgi:hypothetical protein
MNTEKNIKDVYSTLMDETLLRYLVYNSRNPLEVSSTQPDILTLSDKTKIIDKHLIMTPKTSDLTNESKISRLCMYAGNRKPQSRKVAKQDMIFDIYVHEDIDILDLRMAKIKDYIGQMFEDKIITGLGRSQIVVGNIIGNSPNGYVGYRLVYEFGSVS